MGKVKPFYCKKIEIELTSACNAGCPDCARTIWINKGDKAPKAFKIQNVSLDDLEKHFNTWSLREVKIKFCGVLGDPIAHKELLDICEYFILQKNCLHIEVSTNAGLKTPAYWTELGELSAMSGGRLEMHFAIDGLTTNDYRVNVNLDKVWENVNAYLDGGGHATWQYIIFEYNKHEVDDAHALAKEKGMRFATRKSWRNDAPKKEHYVTRKKAEKPKENKDVDMGTIKCKHMEDEEIYIGADGTVWPCCYLYDEHMVKGGVPQMKDFENNIHEKPLGQIMKDPWLRGRIAETFDKNHPLNMPRCWLTCGDKGKRQTQKVVR